MLGEVTRAFPRGLLLLAAPALGSLLRGGSPPAGLGLCALPGAPGMDPLPLGARPPSCLTAGLRGRESQLLLEGAHRSHEALSSCPPSCSVDLSTDSVPFPTTETSAREPRPHAWAQGRCFLLVSRLVSRGTLELLPPLLRANELSVPPGPTACLPAPHHSSCLGGAQCTMHSS